MKDKNISTGDEIQYDEEITFSNQQKLQNKKIYFDADNTQVNIGYDAETWVGFVQLTKE